ncbi:hypothetical protein CHA01nite_08110 [Chryseobacterium hagamense]|uniref:Uncharacterized protein n=1 Tax=Chryseobacterium hagamense TaxID=395935 RepID=A0A511YIP4_9FLAO|nr:hypothetical protein CHA01nite_08110 [Chryseobacterium hagamense]
MVPKYEWSKVIFFLIIDGKFLEATLISETFFKNWKSSLSVYENVIISSLVSIEDRTTE